ncbi:hypothetical protein, partial [uncultured Parasutterella sp.]
KPMWAELYSKFNCKTREKILFANIPSKNRELSIVNLPQNISFLLFANFLPASAAFPHRNLSLLHAH